MPWLSAVNRVPKTKRSCLKIHLYSVFVLLIIKPFPERHAIARAHLRTRLKSPRRAIHRTPKQTKTC